MVRIFCLGLLSLFIFSQSFAQAPKKVYPDTVYQMDDIYYIEDSTSQRYGFYNMESKELITAPVYDSIMYRYRTGIELEYYEIIKDGKWGLLKADRSDWVPPIYDNLDYEFKMNPARIFVQKAGKYGILNEDGSAWLEPIYEEILYDGFYFKVKKGDKWGMLNNKGEDYIPICYEEIYEHRVPELSLVRDKGSLWSVFMWVQNQNPCTPAPQYKYERIEYFNEFFTVYKDGKWGLADQKGELILPIEYEDLKPFVFSYLRTLKVKKNGKYGLIKLDSLGNQEIMAKVAFDDIGIDEDNYKLKVALGDKRDYLYDGEPYFDFEFNEVIYFLNYRMFTVKKGKKIGLIKENKEVLIPPKYHSFLFIDEKTFMVEKNGKWGVINAQGRELIPIKFTEFDYRPDDEMFFAARNGKWGVVSLRAGVILDAKYEDLIILSRSKFLVRQKGKAGVVGPGGRVEVPLEYDDVEYNPSSPYITLKMKDKSKPPFKYRIQ
jgi:hypothetical protein